MGEYKIEVYLHPNREIRSYLTMIEISTFRVEHFKKPFNGYTSDALITLGPMGSMIVKEILTLKGIQELHIKPKEIVIKKETQFSWEDIEKKVLKILNHAFRRKEIRVVRSKD